MKKIIFISSLVVFSNLASAQSINEFDSEFSFSSEQPSVLMELDVGQAPRNSCQREVTGKGFSIENGGIAYNMRNSGTNTRIGINEDSLNIVVDHGCNTIYDNRRQTSDRVVEYEITDSSLGFNITRSLSN